MNRPLLFFADLEPSDILAAQEQFLNSRHSREVLIISGALFLAVFLAVVGVIVYAKRKKRKRHHRHHSSHYRSAQKQLESEAPRKSGKRRRRRSQPPMNPTLAETGGLPPIRDPNHHP